MKFAELGLLSPTNKNLPIIKKNIVLKGKNAYEFEQQLEKLDNFINKNWGFDIDDNGRTAYVRPCLILIISRNFHVVSMCMTGKGSGAG